LNGYEARAAILAKAQKLANEAVARDTSIPLEGSFTADPTKGFGLEIVPGTPAQYLEQLRAIGVKAIHDAVVAKGELFAGLIVGVARQGGNL
jgi:hypothetical protein